MSWQIWMLARCPTCSCGTIPWSMECGGAMAEVDNGVAGDDGAGLAHGAYTWPPPDLSNPDPDGPAVDPGIPAGVAELEWCDAAASPGAGLASWDGVQ